MRSNVSAKVKTMESYRFEPLLLVKWKKLSYAHVTWEPVSALVSDNLAQVQAFLAERHSCGMKRRLLNSRALKTHQ